MTRTEKIELALLINNFVFWFCLFIGIMDGAIRDGVPSRWADFLTGGFFGSFSAAILFNTLNTPDVSGDENGR